MWDWLLNLLLDNLRVSTDTLKGMVDEADTDKDGFVTMRELYDKYRRWKG